MILSIYIRPSINPVFSIDARPGHDLLSRVEHPELDRYHAVTNAGGLGVRSLRIMSNLWVSFLELNRIHQNSDEM